MNCCTISLLFHILSPFFFLWIFPPFFVVLCSQTAEAEAKLGAKYVEAACTEEQGTRKEQHLEQRGYSGQRCHPQLCSRDICGFFFTKFAAASPRPASIRPKLPLESCSRGGRTFTSSG